MSEQKTRLRRAWVAAPNGWRAVYEEDGQLVERPVAAFEVCGRGEDMELLPFTSFAGDARVSVEGDYRGLIGPGQTIESMQSELQAIEDRHTEIERRRPPGAPA